MSPPRTRSGAWRCPASARQLSREGRERGRRRVKGGVLEDCVQLRGVDRGHGQDQRGVWGRGLLEDHERGEKHLNVLHWLPQTRNGAWWLFIPTSKKNLFMQLIQLAAVEAAGNKEKKVENAEAVLFFWAKLFFYQSKMLLTYVDKNRQDWHIIYTYLLLKLYLWNKNPLNLQESLFYWFINIYKIHLSVEDSLHSSKVVKECHASSTFHILKQD